MRIVLLRAIPEDDLLRRQWNGLVQQMEQPEVFYTYEWALAVHRAYGAQMAPLLLLAYEDDTLVGLVALATNSSQATVFLTSSTADYCDFICHPPRRGELVNAVFSTLQELRLPKLQLANLPAHSATIPALQAASRANGYQLFCRPAYFCSRVTLSTSEQKDSMKQSLSRKQMVRRHIKGMGKIGSVEVRHLKSRESLAAALPGFMNAHTARFLATGRIGNLARVERRVFLEELAELLSQQEWITLSCLMVGEQPVAWNYGFEFGGSWFWYQPTFDSGFQKYYPGLCLLTKLIEQACDSPTINRVDLGLGAESYKDRVATDGQQTLDMTLTISSLSCWRERTRYYTSAAIRSVPHLESWTRSCVAYASSVRKQLRMDGFPGWAWNRLHRWQSALFGSLEVFFLEWQWSEFSDRNKFTSDFNLIHPIDLNLLAVAAMHYVDDEETIAYLLRVAKKLESKGSQGFALVNPEGVPLHLCWVADFQDFHVADLGHSVNDAPPDSVLIFDCWTPGSIRRNGYYSHAISGLASQLQKIGKSPWIFSLASTSALAGAEKAGFVRRFSLTRKHVLFMNKMVETQFSSVTAPAAEFSSVA